MAATPQRRIEIGFNLNDSAASLLQLVKRLEPMYTADPPDRVVLDLTRSRYVGPDAVALLTAAVITARDRGVEVVVSLPEGPPALVGFCTFSGLALRLCAGAVPELMHPQNETAPVSQFFRERPDNPEPLFRLIRRHIDLSRDEEDYLRIAIGEVMRNVEEHSGSVTGGWWCGRFLEGTRQVRVAIVDSGQGIGTTVRRRHPEITTAGLALQRTLQGRVSAKSIPTNQGLGISNLAGIVRELRGDLLIISEDAVATLHERDANPTIRMTPVRFPGTVVAFTLRVGAGEVEE